MSAERRPYCATHGDTVGENEFGAYECCWCYEEPVRPIIDASQLGDNWGDLIEQPAGDQPPVTRYGVLCAYHAGFGSRRVSTIGLISVVVMPEFEFTHGSFIEASQLARHQFGTTVYPVLSVMP